MRSFPEVERKKNLGGVFWIKAVTGYSLLADVNYFHFTIFFNYKRANFDSIWRGRKPARLWREVN